MSDPEDRRVAAGIVASLSSYVITAALAVLGAQAVIVTFVLDKREHLTWFYVASAFGLVGLVGSVVCGSIGVYEIAVRGHRGDWVVSTRKGLFNAQTMLALVGLAAVVVSAFFGDPKH